MGAATWALGFYPLTATSDETAGGHDAYDASLDYRRYARACGGHNPITRHIRHGNGAYRENFAHAATFAENRQVTLKERRAAREGQPSSNCSSIQEAMWSQPS